MWKVIKYDGLSRIGGSTQGADAAQDWEVVLVPHG